MAKVDKYLEDILSARYGKEVRLAIYGAINDMNEEIVDDREIVEEYMNVAKDAATTASTSATNAEKSYQNTKTIEESIPQDYNVLSQTVESMKSGTVTNMLKPTVATTTKNGVTCTNNGDGTYTLNGTYEGTAGTTFEITQITDVTFFEKFLGCLFGFGKEINNKRAWLFIRFSGGTTTKEYASTDIKPEVIINSIPQGSTKCYVGLYISGTSGGYTFNNVTFKPMVTPNLNANYDDFVQYTGDKGRLNENLSDIKSTISNSVSDYWVSSKTYTVGEYCIYDNKFWKCIVQHSNQTPSEDIYWTQTSIIEELKAINNTLKTLVNN